MTTEINDGLSKVWKMASVEGDTAGRLIPKVSIKNDIVGL